MSQSQSFSVKRSLKIYSLSSLKAAISLAEMGVEFYCAPLQKNDKTTITNVFWSGVPQPFQELYCTRFCPILVQLHNFSLTPRGHVLIVHIDKNKVQLILSQQQPFLLILLSPTLLSLKVVHNFCHDVQHFSSQCNKTSRMGLLVMYLKCIPCKSCWSRGLMYSIPQAVRVGYISWEGGTLLYTTLKTCAWWYRGRNQMRKQRHFFNGSSGHLTCAFLFAQCEWTPVV